MSLEIPIPISWWQMTNDFFFTLLLACMEMSFRNSGLEEERVAAAFLWQISEIVGHTKSFSFGELENLIILYI